MCEQEIWKQKKDLWSDNPFDSFCRRIVVLTVHESDHARFRNETDKLGQTKDGKTNLENTADKHGHV